MVEAEVEAAPVVTVVASSVVAAVAVAVALAAVIPERDVSRFTEVVGLIILIGE